jgi:hypothetical protein
MTAILFECPHCRVSDQIANGGHAVGGWEGASHWLVRNCNNPLCKRPIFIVFDETQKMGRPAFTYPLTGGHLDANTQFPERVREEFTEASLCLQINAYLSSMTMSRRVLQRCLKHLGFAQHRLFDQIEAAKTAGTIPRRYHQLADEIRHFGNIGAHPDDDNQQLVTKGNAMLLLEFVKILTDEFFVLEQRVATLSRARTGP